MRQRFGDRRINPDKGKKIKDKGGKFLTTPCELSSEARHQGYSMKITLVQSNLEWQQAEANREILVGMLA